MHGTGVLALVGSVCMTLALVTGLLFIVFLVFALALKPAMSQKPASPFGTAMVLSFTATTVGYGGAAWYVAHPVIHTLR
jgi:hypothetical protein